MENEKSGITPETAAEATSILTFTNVSKIFNRGTHSLRNVTVTIDYGEFVFLCGRTGAGKSTFLRLVTKELEPTEGTIAFEGKDLAEVTHKELPFLRRKIGMVRQGSGLFIESLTAAENIQFVMRATDNPEDILEERSRKALSLVGMAIKADTKISDMSIGERKRVEIARAVVNNPKLLIVDEPTANLDRDTAWDIMNLFNEINRCGVTILMVTHDRQMVNILRKRVVTLSKGVMLGDVKKGKYGQLTKVLEDF